MMSRRMCLDAAPAVRIAVGSGKHGRSWAARLRLHSRPAVQRRQPHPAGAPEPRDAVPRHAGVRQARVVQPVRRRQGPRGGQPRRRRRDAPHGAGGPEAGGADFREHRHGAGHDRERERLHAHHAAVERDPAREAHHAALLRRGRHGARGHAVPRAGGARGRHRQGAGDRRPARLPHAEPVRQRGESGGALQDDRAGDLAPDRRRR